MTAEQTLHWVACPAGTSEDGSALRVSVVVAPQLRTDRTTLAPFPDLLDWPARILDPATTFAVELSDAGQVPATRVGADPDPALWRAFFDAGTPVRPWTFHDVADRPIVSYSADRVLRAVRSLWTRVAAAAPDSLPAVETGEHRLGLVDLFGPVRAVRRGVLGEGVASPGELDDRVRQVLAGARAVAARRRASPATRGGSAIDPLAGQYAGGDPATAELARLLLFHRRPAETVELPHEDPAQHFTAAFDFHQMVAALGDHPHLMRRLGLVVDLEVPVDAVPDTGPFEVYGLRVVPTWRSEHDGAITDILDWTAYRHVVVEAERFFRAAQRDPDPAAPPTAPPTGLLPLPVGNFTAQQVDVDGAALKALDLAATLELRHRRTGAADRPYGEDEGLGVPSLRTTGIALVHGGRAEQVQTAAVARLRLHESLRAGSRPWLWAEDLTRGYRLDVLDDHARRWASVHERTVRYAWSGRGPDGRPGEETVTDEGWFQLGLVEPAAESGAEDPNAELYLHERVVTWDGWSLAAPRPGREVGVEEVPVRQGNDPMTALGLSIEPRARPGSLPRLRFGRGYRLRVRTVDLAGNGPTRDEADRYLLMAGVDTPVVPATDTVVHRRFEPVPPPVLVPRVPHPEGASALALVVRSDADRTPEQYARDFAERAEVVAGEREPLRPHDERHLAPPKASVQLVELHGVADAVLAGDTDADARKARIRSWYDEVAALDAGSFDDLSMPGARAVDLVPADAEPGAPAGGRYVCHDVDQVEVPYLVDPLATAVVFRGLPGVPPGAPFVVDTQGSSPHRARAFRLRLTGGDGPPTWDEDARVLTVRLPQAATARVTACSPIAGHEEEMGIVRWCLESLHPADLDRVLEAAREDRFWMVTPWQDLTLVHAVQHPLVVPTVEEFEVWRDRGSVSTDVVASLRLHVPSTHQVDLLAAWSEPFDDPAEPGPETRTGEDVVFVLPLSTTEPYEGWGREDAPCVVEEREEDGHALLCLNTPLARGQGLVTPAAQVFGDTRHRRVTYRMRAASPFRDHFPREWAEDPEAFAVTSEELIVEVPSSAPPEPPRVAEVLPLLGWEPQWTPGEGAELTRRRRGGGVRVWLDRPWFGSGADEQLAVVLGSSLISVRSPTYPYVTLLTRDPAREGAPLAFPGRGTFRNAAGFARALLLENGEGVDLACYQPSFDPGSRRWFCDLDLDTEDAYFPFLRLALARYQPYALRGCELSRVVLADTVQPLPDRTLTVSPEVGGTGPAESLVVRLRGPSYAAVRGPAGRRSDPSALGRVTVTMQHRDPRIADEDLGWRAAGPELELSRTVDGTEAVWAGEVVVAGHDPATSRLLVVERDHLPGDDQSAEESGLVARVVYADHVTW